MSGGRQNTKLPLCQTIPDDNSVSKEKIDEYELKSVMKVIDKIRAEAYNIGLNLRMSTDTLDPIVRLHKIGTHRCAISIMDTWLRGNYDPNGLPYTLHKEKEHQCPSWWDLVWAVCQPSAGENLRLAREIAKKYKTYEEPEDTSAFSNASSTLFDEEDGVTLVTDLDDVWHRWYEIGVALGIPTNKLDPVLEKGNSRLCFQEMISIWIHLGQREEESKRPCWKLLLIAVAASYGGQNPRLARDLLEKHKDNSERAQDATTGQAEAQSKGGRIRGEGDETDPGDTPIDTPAPHQNAPPSSDTVELLQPDVMHPTEDRDKRKSSEQKDKWYKTPKGKCLICVIILIIIGAFLVVIAIILAVVLSAESREKT